MGRAGGGDRTSQASHRKGEGVGRTACGNQTSKAKAGTLGRLQKACLSFGVHLGSSRPRFRCHFRPWLTMGIGGDAFDGRCSHGSKRQNHPLGVCTGGKC